MSQKLKGRACKTCENYDYEKQVCTFFKRKLTPDSYCVVDENQVFFINSS